jgi:cytochrome c-type biogenesis protein CcmH/NrfG
VLKKISLWEHQFFSRGFAADPLDQRLARLEELIFGGVRNGSNSERVERIAKALNQQGDGPAVPPGVAEFVTSPVPPRTSAATPPPAAPTGPIAVMPNLSQTAAPGSPNPPTVPNPVRGPTMTVDKQHFSTSMKPQRVIQNLSDAIRDNPLDAELMYQRGKAYIEIDKPDRALSDISDAIMSQPNRSDYYLARAWVYHMLGNSVLSDLDIKHAQFVDPAFPAKVVWKDQ